MNGKLYLIPTPIGETAVYDVLPQYNHNIINSLEYFVVEDIRSARRFLSRAGIDRAIDTLRFEELNEHSELTSVEQLLLPILAGQDCGVISEAGLPCVADPGAELVAAAHAKGIEIVPLVGPSSIMMALMASGMNGQSFAFNGYIPIRQPDRNKAIKNFERRAIAERQSQIFIEAPYRNIKLLADIIETCSPNTKITIATDITSPSEYIKTKTAAAWKKNGTPDINKRPAIFIIGE